MCGVSEQSPTEKKRTFGEKGDRCRINQKEQQRKFDSFDALLSYIYSSSKRREREKGWANDPHVSFPPDKRMNGRKKERKTNSKFSLLFEFLLSGKRAAASVCVCVPERTRDQHDRYAPCCYSLFRVAAEGITAGEKKKINKLTEEKKWNRVQRRREKDRHVRRKSPKHFWAPPFSLVASRHTAHTDEYLTLE